MQKIPRWFDSISAIFCIACNAPRHECAEDPKGQGAHLSFDECLGSFDGVGPCQVNDTVFFNSHAGNKGGAVSLSGGDRPWTVEFHRCSVENSSVGLGIEDDPQGEGGAFSVGDGVTLILFGCLLKDNSCGKKVGFVVFRR